MMLLFPALGPYLFVPPGGRLKCFKMIFFCSFFRDAAVVLPEGGKQQHHAHDRAWYNGARSSSNGGQEKIRRSIGLIPMHCPLTLESSVILLQTRSSRPPFKML